MSAQNGTKEGALPEDHTRDDRLDNRVAMNKRKLLYIVLGNTEGENRTV
jgi:hypothetical protein